MEMVKYDNLIKRKLPKLQIDILLKLCEGDFSQSEIVKKLGLREDSVSRAVKQLRDDKKLIEGSWPKNQRKAKRLKINKKGANNLLFLNDSTNFWKSCFILFDRENKNHSFELEPDQVEQHRVNLIHTPLKYFLPSYFQKNIQDFKKISVIEARYDPPLETAIIVEWLSEKPMTSKELEFHTRSDNEGTLVGKKLEKKLWQLQKEGFIEKSSTSKDGKYVLSFSGLLLSFVRMYVTAARSYFSLNDPDYEYTSPNSKKFDEKKLYKEIVEDFEKEMMRMMNSFSKALPEIFQSDVRKDFGIDKFYILYIFILSYFDDADFDDQNLKNETDLNLFRKYQVFRTLQNLRQIIYESLITMEIEGGLNVLNNFNKKHKIFPKLLSDPDSILFNYAKMMGELKKTKSFNKLLNSTKSNTKKKYLQGLKRLYIPLNILMNEKLASLSDDLILYSEKISPIKLLKLKKKRDNVIRDKITFEFFLMYETYCPDESKKFFNKHKKTKKWFEDEKKEIIDFGKGELIALEC